MTGGRGKTLVAACGALRPVAGDHTQVVNLPQQCLSLTCKQKHTFACLKETAHFEDQLFQTHLSLCTKGCAWGTEKLIVDIKWLRWCSIHRGGKTVTTAKQLRRPEDNFSYNADTLKTGVKHCATRLWFIGGIKAQRVGEQILHFNVSLSFKLWSLSRIM